MHSSWFLWMAFTLLVLLPPVGYGWGYRRWGPPYPSYIQRRRGNRATGQGAAVVFDHRSWGWRGDFLWAIFAFGMVWSIAAFWWR